MSGIAGIICSSPIARESTGIILDKMLKSILHRGPDDSGKAFFEHGGLGAQRLSIIDIAGGQQPFYHHEKPFILVLSGEIYNYKALRAKLEEKGVTFLTGSDIEVLMMMYDYYDEDMFNYLEGSYAFALWNGYKKELIIARDPLGKKPLYYEMDEHGIAFASELKAILQVRQSHPALNPVAIQNYLAMQFIPSPMTMFDGIFKLPPGYMLRWRIADESLEVWPIWVPDDEVSRHITQNKNITLNDAMEEFDKRIHHAVEQRVKASDVPVGIFLSGGLDSSLITALAKQYVDYPLHTFSVGYTYAKGRQDDRPFGRQASEVLGTTHHELELGPEILDQLPRILWHLDEPLADPSMLALDALSMGASKEFLKVMLTGQGADEIFGGYAKYRQLHSPFNLDSVPGFIRQLLAPALGGLSLTMLGWEHSQMIQSQLNNADHLAAYQTCRNFPAHEREKLLKKGMTIFPDKRLRVFSKSAFEPFIQLQWDEFHHALPHDLLMGMDKMSMGYGVETRSPFLDHHLAAWAIGLPERLKWKGNDNKYLLREYAKRYLPKQIVKRPSQGFDLPMDAWLYGRMEELRRSLLGSALLEETDLFSRVYIEKLLGKFESGALKSAQPIWNLFILKVWYEVFTRHTSKDNLWDLQPFGKRAL